MADESKIQWTDSSWNPWIGCTAVSAGCKLCYAEVQDNFRHWTPEGWGKGKPRKKTSDANWRKPLQWNREAEVAGVRRRVFCASLADVFDDEVDEEWRWELWGLIGQTPFLDWQLLTKRPQNISGMVPWADGRQENQWKADVSMWPNVWLGTTVEDGRVMDRVKQLVSVPASVHFLSVEPMIGPLDGLDLTGIEWVICGGESGGADKVRPFIVEHARDLRDKCADNEVAFFMKQFGRRPVLCGEELRLKDLHGGNWDEWPEDLQVRQMPESAF